MTEAMLRAKGVGDKSTFAMKHSFSPTLSAAGWVQKVILTGPINPRRPVLVKGLSETGTPSAVTGTVCQKREEDIRQWTTH